MNFIYELIYTIPAVLIAISMHEFAHGYMSYRLGDPTPGQTGRLSLNPLAHLDLVGTLCLLIFHFGWAKPVQVNPYYYRDRKKGMLMVALAGPVMNFIIAFLSIFLMGIIIKITGGYGGQFVEYIFNLLNFLYIINIGLGVFNLIPIPPLDGSKVLAAILPEEKYFSYMRYERYGGIILIGLLYLGVLDKPLGNVRSIIHGLMSSIVSLILGLG